MKRRAFKLLLFVFAGAIINVAVAWGCVSHLNPQSFEVIASVVPIGPGRTQDSVSTYIRTGHRQVEREFAMDILAEGTIPDRPMSPRLEVLSGWPLFGMQCFGFINAPRGGGGLDSFIMTEDVFQVDAFRWGIPWRSRVYWLSHLDGPMCKALPLRPLVPGFAINTIFYAAILYALFAVPGAVRRRVRIKRGQCASCGYSLRESVSERCPECGCPTPFSRQSSLRYQNPGRAIERNLCANEFPRAAQRKKHTDQHFPGRRRFLNVQKLLHTVRGTSTTWASKKSL